MAASEGTDAAPAGTPPHQRSWAERHTGKVAAGLLMVPLALRSVLVSAGASEDAADLVQIVVGGAALAVFTAIILRSRRRADAT